MCVLWLLQVSEKKNKSEHVGTCPAVRLNAWCGQNRFHNKFKFATLRHYRRYFVQDTVLLMVFFLRCWFYQDFMPKVGLPVVTYSNMYQTLIISGEILSFTSLYSFASADYRGVHSTVIWKGWSAELDSGWIWTQCWVNCVLITCELCYL